MALLESMAMQLKPNHNNYCVKPKPKMILLDIKCKYFHTQPNAVQPNTVLNVSCNRNKNMFSLLHYLW